MLNNSLLIALSSPNVSCILGENILLLFYSLPSNYFYSWQSTALRKTSANSCICCSLYFLAFLESCISCIKFPISAFPHWLSFLSPTNQKEIILWKNYKETFQGWSHANISSFIAWISAISLASLIFSVILNPLIFTQN